MLCFEEVLHGSEAELLGLEEALEVLARVDQALGPHHTRLVEQHRVGVAALEGGDHDLDPLLVLPAVLVAGLVGAAADRCRARLVPVEGEAVDLLVATWPFYSRAVIPGGTYLANPQPVPSFGLRTTLVAAERLSEERVYWLVRSLFERIDDLRGQHPILSTLDPKTMVSQGSTLKLHDGALRYYRERGWK